MAADDAMPIPGSLESTAAEIEALGRGCVVPMDLMERPSVEQRPSRRSTDGAGSTSWSTTPSTRVPGTMDRIFDLPLELAERCLVGDYLHPLLLIQLLLPQMLERGEGRLVNMLSEAAFTTPPAPAGAGGWGVAYAAAKAAFHRVTDMCHVEFVDSGIWAFSIAPGSPSPSRCGPRAWTRCSSTPATCRHRLKWPARWPPGWPTTPTPTATPGQMVSSRSLCKELGLVAGWPPPKPA